MPQKLAILDKIAMGNEAMRAPFCCKGRRGFDQCLKYDTAGEEDLAAVSKHGIGSSYEYGGDQSEVDMERGVTLVSVLKHNN